MATLKVTTRAGKTAEIEGDTRLNVMEILRERDFEVAALCGGCCSCATCHVYVGEAWVSKLPKKSGDEADLLASCEFERPNSRLACQIPFAAALDGMEIEIAPED